MAILISLLLLCHGALPRLSEASGSLDLLNHIAPQQVRFYSLDFRNTLHWEAHSQSLSNTQYYVQYKVYGDKQWTDVPHCQGIHKLSCDLSQQTSEPRDWYYARVQAEARGLRSTWTLSPRFSPVWNTSVSPPGVELKVTEQGIVVRLRPPRSPYRRRSGSPVSVRKLQPLKYRIYLSHNNVVQKRQELDSCVRELLIEELEPGTTYCLRAESLPLRPSRSSGPGPSACVTTL
ncbi:interleukin-22 receptor subunit alpha-2-like [Megalops cyprinoides]|uniref:interleukin-22 receptor subunit alpha-2-like n=1 Tax=Megalops cyprinoides TaxID=118141 RepID=UPI0018647CE1|nr:interleukin-22 receptor subunit alpha-2-like [Megalops cyprinoides]XP_036403222.1 interleukin-22 receptor subunit alpha-2-like [Megalops cyprinoides]